MPAQTTTLRPNGDVRVPEPSPAGTDTTGGTTAAEVYADESDASFTFGGGTGDGMSHSWECVCSLPAHGIPNGSPINRVRAFIRWEDPSAGTPSEGFAGGVSLTFENPAGGPRLGAYPARWISAVDTSAPSPGIKTTTLDWPLRPGPTTTSLGNTTPSDPLQARGRWGREDFADWLLVVAHSTGAAATGGNVYRVEVRVDWQTEYRRTRRTRARKRSTR